MDYEQIQELRAAVLRDLSDFTPKGYYNYVRTSKDLAVRDFALSNRIVTGHYTTPQLTPRQ